MRTSFANAAWPACTSALRLDRWMAGELPRAEELALADHVAGCAPCREAVESLEAARAAPLPPLPQLHGPARPVRAAARRRWPAWAGVGAGALAAAAAALLVLLPSGAGDTRVKGAAPALSMYVRHGDRVRRAEPGERIAAGDAVRFAVTLPRPSYVAVLSLDPAGRASVYFPDTARAQEIAAGAEIALPLATRLDATVGEEQVFGLFCDRPLDLAPVRALVDAAAAGSAPAGCQVTRWSFVKR